MTRHLKETCDSPESQSSETAGDLEQSRCAHGASMHDVQNTHGRALKKRGQKRELSRSWADSICNFWTTDHMKRPYFCVLRILKQLGTLFSDGACFVCSVPWVQSSAQKHKVKILWDGHGTTCLSPRGRRIGSSRSILAYHTVQPQPELQETLSKP